MTTRHRQLAVLLGGMIMLTADLHAQTRPGQALEATRSAALAQADQQLSLTGCAASAAAPSQITFVDEHHSLLYRLTDRGMRLSRSRRLNVVGGLVPTTNLAAQPDNAVEYSMAWQRQSPIGSTPFAAPKKRTMWTSSLGGHCHQP